MKAIVLTEPGGVENLQFTELEKPIPIGNELLIKVTSLSINPVDIKTRTGKGVYGRIKTEQPLILGWDISGEVVETGPQVTKFKKGDQVFGMVNFPGHGKAYAEYVTAPETQVSHKPSGISHPLAAAGTLAALTAWQVLVQQAKIRKGEILFMHAAAGGVGHFAVQIAKNIGASVIGTGSDYNAEYLTSIGVDQFIDYNKSDFEKTAGQVDVVFDPLGANITERSLNILKPGGRLVSIVGGVTEAIKNIALDKKIEALNYLVQSSGEDIKSLAELYQNGRVKAHVSSQFDFKDMAKAHQQLETGKTRGKIVVNL